MAKEFGIAREGSSLVIHASRVKINEPLGIPVERAELVPVDENGKEIQGAKLISVWVTLRDGKVQRKNKPPTILKAGSIASISPEPQRIHESDLQTYGVSPRRSTRLSQPSLFPETA